MGLLFVGVVVFLSLDPEPPDIAGFPGFDKVSHFAAYGFMMLWFGCCYVHGAAYRNLGMGLVAMGIFLEFLQGMMGHRSMEISDMLVNAMGVSFGWFMAKTRIASALIYLENQMFNRGRH